MIKCTVCIPVLNGGGTLDGWFNAVLSQKVNFEYEILVVDSGSTDNSVEIIKKWQNSSKVQIELIQIPNSEFGHGKTRNLMSDQAKGQILVFTVQDALPSNSYWLQNLVTAFEVDARLGGVFGRHIANRNSHPISMRYIDKTFREYCKNVRNLSSVVEKGGVLYYTNPKEIQEWDRFLSFSNVNAAYRADVLRKVRFAQMDFAEDRQFVKDAVKAGYLIGYVDKAAVYHSHDYNLKYTFKKTFDEWRAIGRLGGYPYKFRGYHIITQSLIGYFADLRYILKSERLNRLEKVKGIGSSPFRQLVLKTAMYFGLNYRNIPHSWVYKFSEQADRRDKTKR